jgi:protoporphyrinogen IX oxidase
LDDPLFYGLIKSLHIIAVIAWMAGLLMLPRFYAYQTGAQAGGELEKKMIEAASKLNQIILTPAMLAAWIFGLWLVGSYHLQELMEPMGLWLWLKIALVLALSGLHGFFVAQGRRLAKGERPKTEKFWRMINEVPFVIAIVVVFLVILRPGL